MYMLTRSHYMHLSHEQEAMLKNVENEMDANADSACEMHPIRAVVGR